MRLQLLETKNGTTRYTPGKPGPLDLVGSLAQSQADKLTDDSRHFFEYLCAVRSWKLRTGKTKIKVAGEIECDYEGELDEYDNAYGEGILKWPTGTVEEATWMNNEKHGYCIVTDPSGEVKQGEVKNGSWCGELTVYW